MAFIVQGVKGPGDDATSATVETSQEALAVAVRWAEEARDVKIIGNGRIYSIEEFAAAILSSPSSDE